MNRIYRLVWSRTHGMLIAVAETSSSRSKAGTARQGRPRKVAFAVALALGLVSPLALGHSMVDQIGPDQARKGRDGQLVALVPPPVAGQNMAGPTQSGQSGTNPIGQPLPVGGQVVAGVVRLSQSGDTLTIQQATRSAILNWQSFDISAGYTVDFVQPDAGSVALNRVLGGNPSDIFGQLHANGQVFLVNAAGVYFAPGAEVNVGGLVASTLGISNADFLSGNYHFTGNSGATIRNGGTITSVPRGYVAFIGNHVDNTGKIITPGGTTALGAGAGVDITLANSQLVNFRVSADALNALAANGGLIQADGGRVILSAQARSALLQSVVNNTGVVRTQTVAIHEGVIELLGGNSGTVEVAGTLDASAPAGGNGGQIETSGAHVKVADGTFITTTSSTGKSGNWLIDPTDFTIAASGGDISGATLSSNLGNGNVTIVSTDGTVDGNGDIFVNDSVTWDANTLTLNAQRNIDINTAMNGSGTAGLALQYGQGSTNGVISGVDATYNVNAPINLASTGSFSTQLGTNVGNLVSYIILTSLGAEADASTAPASMTLQGINTGLGGNYVLGADIDASATSGWNSGAGFAPLGPDNGNGFSGVFDGLGHTISDLTINRPSTDFVGLFGYVSGDTLRNIGLVGGSVSGRHYVGGLVGFTSNGTIGDAYATGSVSGTSDVGGLVGRNDSGTISDVYATGSVSASGSNNSYVGGLVGHNASGGTISDAYASGSVSGHYFVGGLAGFTSNGTISDAYATGSVSGTSYVGGLVGYNGRGTISDAYATGSVSASGSNNSRVGGLVGSNASGGTISDAYATGSVSGTGNVGGLVGFNYSMISNAYATGSVSGSGHVGGLVGFNYNSTISNSYWDSYSTGQTAAVGYIVNGTVANITAVTSDPTQSGAANYAFKQGAYGSFDFTAGTGTWFMVDGSTRPFLASEYSTTISNAHQLQLVAMDLGANYTLASNLDASETARAVNSSAPADAAGMWSKAGFAPLGTSSTHAFTGTFDGLGQTINSLYINRIGITTGLFGVVGANGVVRDVGLVAGSVTGSSYAVGALVGSNAGGTISHAYATSNVSSDTYDAGGLVGWNTGTITGSYATGNVSGTNSVGGLVGANNNGTITDSYATGDLSFSGGRFVGGLVGYNAGTIANAYATGNVDGNDSLGGLAGINSGTITNAYATGRVTGNSSVGGLVGKNNSHGVVTNTYAIGNVSGTSNVGGLVGQNAMGFGPGSNGGTISNSYWDTTTAAGLQGVGNSNNANVVGKTTVVLAAALPTGFDASDWGNGDKQTTPYLLSHASIGTVSGSVILGSDASATPTRYGVILTLDQLQNINSTGLSGNYVLGNNIDASATSDWNAGAGFVPLGDVNHAFTGTFDGLKHTIASLTINRPASLYIGMFGNMTGGTLRDIGLIGANINGFNRVGGLVGYSNNNTINDAYVSGNLSGTQFVGGLVGFGTTGTISNAYFSGSVSGDRSVGGLIGNNGGTISNAYAIGSVSGNSKIGGLIGNNTGTVSNVYASNSVIGSSLVGGLVGGNNNGTITNGYWNTALSGQSSAAGLNAGTTIGGGGLDDVTMMQQASFNGFDFNNVWVVYAGHTDPLLRHFLTALTITSDNQTQTYDGTTFALSNATYSVAGAATSGNLYGLSDSYGGAINAGATVYAPQMWSDQQGYLITYSGGSLTINPKTLAVTGLAGTDKIYDGSTTDTLSGNAVLQGLVSGESLTINNAGSGMLASANAGSQALSTSITLGNGSGGGLASNYTLAQPTLGNITVTPAGLTVTGLSGNDKIYDGSTNDVLSGSAVLQGLVSGQSLTIGNALLGSLASANAGSQAVSTAITLGDGSGGGLASNYTLTQSALGNITVTPAGLTVTGLAGTDKIYDGSTSDVLSGSAVLQGLVSGQSLTINNSGTGSLASANVGSQAVSTAITLDDGIGGGGGLASNYTLTQPVLGNITVTPAGLTVTGLAGTDKIYDGSTSDPLGGVAVLQGLISGESLTINNAGSGMLASANAGSQALSTSITLGNGSGGGLASNYTLTQPLLGNITVTPARLTVTGQSGSDKIYDGSTSDLLNGNAVLQGLVSGQSLTINNARNGTLASANVGRQAVSTAITLGDGSGGGLASNYTLTQATLGNITVTPAGLTVTGLAGTDKIYDGSTSDPLSGNAVLQGLISGQTLTINNATLGTLAGANAGNQAVSTALTLTDGSGGGLASNYTLTQPVLGNITVTPAGLTVTGLSGTDKMYDGSTSDPLSGIAVLQGLVTGESLTINNAALGTLASADVGSQAVSTAITLGNGSGGDLASNYTLIQPSLTNVMVLPPKADTGATYPDTGSATGLAERVVQGGYVVPAAGPGIWLDPRATYDLVAGPGKPAEVNFEICTGSTSEVAPTCSTAVGIDPFANAGASASLGERRVH